MDRDARPQGILRTAMELERNSIWHNALMLPRDSRRAGLVPIGRPIGANSSQRYTATSGPEQTNRTLRGQVL
jgi:hypothetical protein